MADRPITRRAKDSKHNANLCSMTCEQKCCGIITRFETHSIHFQAHAVTAYGAISDEGRGGGGRGGGAIGGVIRIKPSVLLVIDKIV